MKIKIFYSWQSDRLASTNQEFIQEAIQLAIERIKSNDLEVEPILDRDTEGLPGSPAIADSIFEKIERCGLFLCDITFVTHFINEKGNQRLSPNPNVLIELGYAAAKIGWGRIICVMNQVHGEPKFLPFDLQHRRWPIVYHLSNGASDNQRSTEKQRFSESIELAIRSAIESGIFVKTTNPKDARVALKFERAVGGFIFELVAFLNENGLENAIKLFQEDHNDAVGTNFPNPRLVDSIIDIFARNNLKSPSNTQIGDQKLTWAGAFIHELNQLAHNCERILDRYADRDDRLIAIIDEVQEHAHQLRFMIETSFTQPALANLYDKGVPEAHIDWFRYFLLTLLKARRIIHEFNET